MTSDGRSTESRRVAVVGLGRIGLPTAIVCARAGHEVTGVEVDEQIRDSISRGEPPFDEPGITSDELRSLPVVDDLLELDADVYVLCVGTARDGQLDPGMLLNVAARLPRSVGALIIVESTIPPGTCRRIVTMGHERVAHCPERARPGEVLDDFQRVPRLVGGVDEQATEAAIGFYETLTDAELIGCSADEAALAKLAENAEREIRIAFANELADVAWEYELDGAHVADLAATHPRSAMLSSGVGVGGRCLPMATNFFARHGSGLAARTRGLHERRPLAIARRIAERMEAGATVCVLGRGYRANVAQTDGERTPAVELIEELEERGFEVTSWDLADGDVRSLEDAIGAADAYYVAVEHDEFADLDRAKRIIVT